MSDSAVGNLPLVKREFPNVTLYCGDCLDVLPLHQEEVNAIVADPEYGNGYKVNKKRSRISSLDWGNGKQPDETKLPVWTGCSDSTPFDPSVWLDFPQVILWGANHYASRLPDTSCWLVWNKLCGKARTNFSDCELAFTNLRGPARIFDHLWRGLVRAGEENASNGPKLHPWQKPIALMRWCVDMTEGVVLDPYMGSGTTGVACVEQGRRFIGVEKEPEYFEIACERIERASRQGRLFN